MRIIAFTSEAIGIVVENMFTLYSSSSLTACYCCSAAKSCTTLWPHGLQHPRLPCPSPPLRVCSNSCPLSQWSSFARILKTPQFIDLSFLLGKVRIRIAFSFLFKEKFLNWSIVVLQCLWVQQNDSVLYCVCTRACVCVCINFFRFFSIMGYYTILNIVICAMQWVLTVYLLYMW